MRYKEYTKMPRQNALPGACKESLLHHSIGAMRLLVMLPDEGTRRLVRRIHASMLCGPGDGSQYALPVAIILGEAGTFTRRHYRTSLSFSTQDVASTPYGYVLLPRERETISAIQKELGLPEMTSGLYMGLQLPVFPEKMEVCTSRLSLALAERTKEGYWRLMQ